MKRIAVLILLTLGLVTTPSSAEVVQEGNGYTFRLDVSTWTDRPTRVNVAGDFNGWNGTATPMSDEDGDNVWTATVTDIEEGTRYYKFVVDGDRWISDPTGDKELEQDDNYGGTNSGFVAGPDIRKAPPPKPDHIATEFVKHDPTKLEDASVVDEGRLRLRVRARADDVEEVFAVPVAGDRAGAAAFRSFYEQKLANASELQKANSERGLDTFTGTLPFDGEEARYIFILIDGEEKVAVYRDFIYPVDGAITLELGERLVPYTREGGNLDIPDWSKTAQWYQIFPERFRNGTPENDPGAFEYETLVPWNGDWWSALPGEAPGQENFYNGAGNVWKRRYGGDLQGVREKLPYLRELGIDAIYFNPVFEAESMHKYDTADFRHVDDNFGLVHHGDTETQSPDDDHSVYPYAVEGETDDPATWKWSASDRVFLDFIEEAHAQGFKVVIDGVFNHVGTAHPFFQDVLKNGKESRYADWFEITDWGNGGEPGKPGGIQWAAWDKASGALPVFKKDAKLGLAPGPREHIFAITKRWTNPDGDPATNDGVDGWRLDVPGDIPHPFWKDWRKVVKEANPEAYITGEIWTQAQPWLQGDEFDAVMNYQFAMAAQDFFVDERTAIAPSEFGERLESLTEMYPWPITLALQNLFDSHDTDRLASMFVNPDRPYDGANRLQDNSLSFEGPPYSPRKPDEEEWARLVQAVQFQQAFVGSPMTYYGNEAGMWSPDDPSNRQPFPWPDQGPYSGGVGFNEDIFKEFQHAIAVRNTLPALETGQYRTILSDDERGLFGFSRTAGDETVYVVLNRSGEERRAVIAVEPGTYDDYLDEAATRLVEPTDPKARATVEPTGQGIETDEELLELSLDPWDVAIVKRRK